MLKLDMLFNFLIYAFIILMPILPSKFKLGKMPINGDIILFSIFLIYFIKLVVDKHSRRRLFQGVLNLFKDYLDVFIFLWIAIILVSLTYAADKKGGLNEAFRFSTYFALYFIVKYEVNKKQVLDNILRIYLLNSLVIGVYGIIEFFNGTGIAVKDRIVGLRISSFLENSNNLGAYFVLLIFPVLVMLINEKRKPYKLFYFILFSVAALNILLSGSRNAMLCSAIGFFVLFGLYYKKIFAGISVFGVIFALSPPGMKLVKYIIEKLSDPSRIKLWTIAELMIKDRPLKGVGIGNYRAYYPDYEKLISDMWYQAHDNFHPHNAYLKAFSELGVFGFISFTGILIAAAVKMMNFFTKVKDENYSFFYKGFFISAVVFIFMNVIDNFFSAPKVVTYYWVLLAVAESYSFNFTSRA